MGLALVLVSDIVDAGKRLLLGRPVRSDRLGHTLLPKRIALPVFASDALSSVAYAPDEILLTLSLAGLRDELPRRLAERARKLGNVRFVLGDEVEARRLLRFALRLDPFNLRAWLSLAAANPLGAPIRWLLASRMRSLRTALGNL